MSARPEPHGDAIRPLALRIADPVVQSWVELRFATVPLALSEILFAVRRRAPALKVTQLVTLLRAWSNAGFVERVGDHSYRIAPSALRLADPPRCERVAGMRPLPATPKPRHRLWTAMRILGRFDLPTLAMTASVRIDQGRDFVRLMTRAGYLRAAASGDGWIPGERPAGPRPPIVAYRRTGCRNELLITDRNDLSVTRIPITPRARVHRTSAAQQPVVDGGRINHVC